MCCGSLIPLAPTAADVVSCRDHLASHVVKALNTFYCQYDAPFTGGADIYIGRELPISSISRGSLPLAAAG